jgi:hypothetical protein
MEKEETTVTITFGDCGENHAGMEKIGAMVDEGQGFSKRNLLKAKAKLEDMGIVCELVHLSENQPEEINAEDPGAYLLIARKAVDVLLKEGSDALFDELLSLDVDKKAFMYGRVVNKKARYNLCFGDVEQEPNYEEKAGRIIKFGKDGQIPLLTKLRNMWKDIVDDKGEALIAEGNYYYDQKTCGIGYHSDLERRKVIAVRLGCKMNLCYHWYKNSERVGTKMEFWLENGDVYFMSEKAVGADGRKKKIYTLRHAAGSKKYTE